MATRESPVRHPPSRIPPNPPLRLSYNPSLLISDQQGYVEEIKNLPSADRVEAANVLEKGRILYYYRLATGKLNKTKYGMCFLLKDKFEWFQMVSFIKPRKVKTILNHDHDYFFYSDLTLIDIPQRVHYVSAIQEITEETVEYLLPFLLIKDWKYHSKDTPFISLEAFLHHIMSISANIFMIKRLSSIENIDWGFVDNKGNSFIHAACELKRNIDLAKTIIDNAINNNQLLINMPNVENLTPLRLCLDKINQITRGDYSCINFVEYLIEKGATLIIHKNDCESMAVTNQFFISCLQVENHGENELIIAYKFPKKGDFRSNIYLYSKLDKLDHCQITRTNKLQKKPDLLANILKEQFDLVLLTNCPQVIEYIFNPDNELLSKSDRVNKHKDTMVHLTVRFSNPVILQYILTGYECWDDTNEFGDNLLHTFIEKYNSPNIKGKELVSNTPRDHLNQLAFENRDRECLTCLVLKIPIDSLASKNNAGCTPLQLAVIYSFVPAVELLLENSIINLNSEDNSGFNVLYNSIIHYNEVIFKMVLSAVLKFDDIYNLEDKLIDACIHQESPLTPFLLSIKLNKLDATELLVSNGARIANPCSLLKYSKELDDLKRLFMIKVDGRNIPVLILPTEIQNLQFNRSHILEFFYSNGEFKDFKKCVEALLITKIIEQNTELNTILHFAIENPFEDKLKFLLDQISDLAQSDGRALQLINAINRKGETALYLAVKNSYHALAKRIMDIGASIETLYANGDNILHVSIRIGKQAMINVLLAQTEMTKLFCNPNKEGNTPVQMLIHNGLINQALTAIEKVSQNVEIHNLKVKGRHILEYFYLNGDLDQFKRCFQALPVTKIIKQNDELNTILHLAIQNPFEEKLNCILDQISDLAQSDGRALQLINAINRKGETALYLAVKSSNHVLAKRILDIGASIETIYANGNNILHVSICLGDQKMIEFLISELEITKLFCKPNKEGKTPVQMLTKNGFINQALSVIEKVSQNGEIHSLKINGCHILEYFYMKGEPEHFQRCFQALPITKIFEQNTEFNTILHLAIENPFEEKLNFLLDLISNLVQSDEKALQFINTINGKRETALYLAVKKSCHALTMVILDIGASIGILYANEDNILHVAIDLGDQIMINILLTRPEITKLFCRQNKDGNTPIHLLIRNGYIDEALVAIGRIRPENLLGDDGEFLLMLAIGLDNQIVQNAIFNRLPIDSLLKVENIRREILHYAINHRSIFSIQRLIRHNIDITVSDSSGKPALQFAIDLRNDQIWSLLFEYLITFNEHKQHEIVDIPNLNHPNLFQYSIMENYFPAVRDLLKLRPNIFITHHVNEDTIIHLATKLLDCVPILNHLLNQINREDVDALLQSTNSLDLTPLHYAVHCGNTEALKLFQQFNLKIAVPSDRNLFFFNKLFSDTLVLCKHLKAQPNSTQKTFLFGYKVNSPEETQFILTDIPHLKHCKLYQQAEVEVVHRVNEEDLSILLQVPNTDFFQILISKQIINLENSFSNESTLLHQAARHSNCSVLNYFVKCKGSGKELAHHMDLFALDSIGNSVLYYAIQNSNEEKLNEFLSSILTNILECLKINPQFPNILNKENANSKRILEVCFDLNKFDAFKCMLDPTFQMELTYEDSDGCTLLHKIVKGRGDERFFEALLDEIKRRILHESFAKYLNHPTRDLQQTALHLCILKNQMTLLILISKYSPNFSCKDKDDNTPLHLATKLKSDNKHSTTNALIRSFIGCILNLEGDTISLLNAVNNQCLTPIHFAIMNGNIHISNLLLSKGANLYVIDNDRKSVLHYAIETENKAESEKVINFLLDYELIHPNPGNDLLQMQDKQGNTPLHSAVTLLKSNLIKILLNRSPNLAISDNNKKTVLHLSFYFNSQEIVTLILEYIATTRGQNQVINMQDDQGNSPLHIAIKYESCHSLKKLLSAKATLDLKDNSGQTPLHLAILKGEEVFNHIFTAIEEKIQLSPDNYHYLTIVNNEGLPPLHFALMNATNMSYIRKLINIGAKLSYTDKMGSVTMCAGKGGLDLCLLKQVKYGSRFQLLNHFSEGWIGVNWLVGFKIKLFPLWVVTKLLELEETEILEEQNVTVVTQFRFEDEILVNLIKCESIDPIRVAIEKNLFPHETIKNGKKLLSFVQDKDGSVPVRKFVKNSFRPVEEICFWIKTSVFDLKEMNLIFESLHNLNFTLIMSDSSKLCGEELKRNEISIALSNALLYSLDNESIEYFNFLLSHNLCLNAQYGVEKDSLLHAMIKKKKSNEFLALFLNTVCEYEKMSKEKIFIKGEPLIDARNAESLTPLALCVINKQERILNFLLTHKPSLTVLSDSGNSILHYVATAGDEAITEIIFSKILNSPDNIRNLFNMPNSDGCIPLHLAVEKGNVKLSEMFLNNGSKFYSQDFAKRTILHHAIENPDQTLQNSMIEFILTYEQNNQASLDRRIYEIGDVDNSIPLNYAIERSSLIAVKLLAPYPSMLNHRNSNNQTVLHLVSMKRDNDIFDEVFYHISNQERNRDDLDCIACCKDKKGLIALDVCIKQQNEHAKRKLLGYTLCLNLSTCQWNPNLNQAFIVETYFEIKKTLNEVITRNSELILQVHLYYLENKNNVICFQDDIKLTTMYSAIFHNYSHAFESLLKTSSFVNILDDNGEA